MILAGVAAAVGLWFLAHRHGKLQGFIDAILHLPSSSAFLLVHGANDEVFPVADCRRLAELLKTEGVAVEMRIFPGQSHDFGADKSVMNRGVAEYCASFFSRSAPASGAGFRALAKSHRSGVMVPSSALPEAKTMSVLQKNDASAHPWTPGAAGLPLHLNVRQLYLHYWIPFGLLLGFILARQYLRWRKSVADIPRGKLGTIVLWLAWILGTVALVDTAIHIGFADGKWRPAPRPLIEAFLPERHGVTQ